MTEEATPAKVRLTDGLGRLLDDWAEASGNTFHHGTTLRGVDRDDLLTLLDVALADRAAAVMAMRDRCAKVCDDEARLWEADGNGPAAEARLCAARIRSLA